MANQEEELRQNMEEMQATQEEMLRKNQETEQAHNELSKAMAENERQLKKLSMVLETSNVGLWEMLIVKGDPVNPNNTFQWSDEFRHMLGFSGEADFPNVLNSWSDKLHPEDKEKTLDAFAKHLLDRTGNTPYDLNYRLLKKNGEYGYFYAYGTTFRDENGYAIRVEGVVQDITKSRHDELELRETLEKVKEAQETSEEKEHELQQFYNAFSDTCYLIVYSSEGVLTDINEKLLKFFNADKSVFVGKHMSEYLGEETCRTVLKNLEQGKHHEEFQSVDTGVGGVIKFRQRFIPICNKEGKLSWILLLTEPEKE
jgi:PAS domain S-box-containing protein